MRNNCFVFPDFFSRNVRNSIKCEKNITPPPPFEIQNQNKGIEDIMDIDSNCPSLLFGETTAHLTSKWRGTFQYFFYVENSIKREIRKNCFPKKKKIHTHPPPPDFFFTHPDFFLTPIFFFFNVGNSMKREENLKYWKKIFFKFYFFQYLKNSYKIQTTFHQYQKLYSTPPWHGAHTCKSFENIHQCVFKLQCEN